MRVFDLRPYHVARTGCAFVLLMLAHAPLWAQSAQRLFEFNDITSPTYGHAPSRFVEHPNGLLYAINRGGGSFSSGTVFSMTVAGTVTVVHTFAGGPADGATPFSLILGEDGNLYGSTERGGANNCGVLFKMTPAGLTSVVQSWTCFRQGFPVHAADGRVYISIDVGGAFNAGSFYYVSADGSVTTLYHYPIQGTTPCAYPLFWGPVVNGKFYASDRGGCVFSITLDGTVEPLANVPGTAVLTLGRDGYLYIARHLGFCPGSSGPCGRDTIVSRVALTGQVEDVATSPGWVSWLTQAADGSFVGASITFFSSCAGPVFGEPTPPCSILQSRPFFQHFSGVGAATPLTVDFMPISRFISAANGLLYGIGFRSGDGNWDSAFLLTPPKAVPTVTVNGQSVAPDTLVAGLPASWTASNTLLTSNVEFKFWVLSDVGWRVVQDYSPDPVLHWSPARAGRYLMQVWTRAQGSSAAWEGYQTTGYFDVAAPPPVSVTSLLAQPSLPTTTGEPTTFSATASGGVGPLQYQFFLLEPGTGWRVLQPWSADSDVMWTPSTAGNYTLQVWVRSANSTAAFDAWQGIGAFVVNNGPLSITMQADRPLPIGPGGTVTWTATPAGGDGSPLEFAFYRYHEASATWTLVRAFASTPSWSWTPAAGDIGVYWLQVWARRQGSTAAFEAWTSTPAFAVSSAPLTVTLTSSQNDARQVPALTSITWRAEATNAIGPLEYQFWRFDGRSGTWSLVQDYGASDTYAWTSTLDEAGFWALQVWVRPAGSTQLYQAWSGTGYFLVAP